MQCVHHDSVYVKCPLACSDKEQRNGCLGGEERREGLERGRELCNRGALCLYSDNSSWAASLDNSFITHHNACF